VPIDQAIYFTPVCDDNCGWAGNATPNESHAKESLEHHMAAHAAGEIPELDELGNTV
jgi:hypothetical protein